MNMANEVRACKICGRIFNYIYGDEVCPACKETQEDLFHRIKDYLWDNRGATEAEVAEIFDVSHKQLLMWLREGRLELCENSVIKLECEKCGAPILTGRLCKDCLAKQKEVVRELDKSMKKDKDLKVAYVGRDNSRENAKMRFFGGGSKKNG